MKLRMAAAWLICAVLCGCTADGTESIVISHAAVGTTTAEFSVETTAMPAPPVAADAPETAWANAAEAEITYVLNTNSKKFHLSSCASVKDMKDKNRRDSDADRAEIIADGYAPCKRCNP